MPHPFHIPTKIRDTFNRRGKRHDVQLAVNPFAPTKPAPPKALATSAAGYLLKNEEMSGNMELGNFYENGRLVKSPYKSRAAANAAARKKAAASKLKKAKTPSTMKPKTVPRKTTVGTTTRPRVVLVTKPLVVSATRPRVVQAIPEPAQKLSIWDKIFSLSSQIISGNSRNPTIQTVGGQVPIYQPVVEPHYQPSPFSPGYNPGADYSPNDGNSPGGAVGSGIDGIIQWATANPLFVFGGIGALYLLFKESPRKR